MVNERLQLFFFSLKIVCLVESWVVPCGAVRDKRGKEGQGL